MRGERDRVGGGDRGNVKGERQTDRWCVVWTLDSEWEWGGGGGR